MGSMSLWHWIAVAVILFFILFYKNLSNIFNGRPKLEVLSWIAGILSFILAAYIFIQQK
jgi:multisubunit Na+/H+ antiporter MnhB subunit